MKIEIKQIDHIVLTVESLERTVQFYSEILGMKPETFGDNRVALIFGDQKINLHEKESKIKTKAQYPTPGSVDICFISKTPLAEVMRILNSLNIEIIEGPVQKVGAHGTLLSVYIRDPDKNLVELSEYL